jgi:hypothetical protein
MESYKRKEDALAALKVASEKLDAYKHDCEGIRVLLVFYILHFLLNLSCLIFMTCLYSPLWGE